MFFFARDCRASERCCSGITQHRDLLRLIIALRLRLLKYERSATTVASAFVKHPAVQDVYDAVILLVAKRRAVGAKSGTARVPSSCFVVSNAEGSRGARRRSGCCSSHASMSATTTVVLRASGLTVTLADDLLVSSNQQPLAMTMRLYFVTRCCCGHQRLADKPP